MKSLAITLVSIGLLASAIGRDAVDGKLPSHSTWRPAKFGDFEFRIAEIDVDFSVRDIESPPPIDSSDLVSCANWFVHHWQHTNSLEGLQSLLESEDEFQTASPFERLSQKDRIAMERSYSHIIDYRGFYFLLGTMRRKDGSSLQAIGVYRWDSKGGRFHAILNTPEFRKVSGLEFRSDLYKLNLETLTLKEGP